MPTAWYSEFGGAAGPDTAWTTEGVARVGSQIPYWIGPTVPIGTTVARDGFALANASVFGGFFAVVGASVLPAYIVGWRMALARTGPVDPSASVILSVWDGPFGDPTLDLATRTPLATASYPLSSLELVDPAYNYLLRGLGAFGSHPAIPTAFPYIELPLTPSPLISTVPTTLIYAVYLSSGFSVSPNLVVGNGPFSVTGNSLVLGNFGGGGSSPGFKTWFDRPNNSAGYDFEGVEQAKGLAHLWGVSPVPFVEQRRGRSYAQISG